MTFDLESLLLRVPSFTFTTFILDSFDVKEQVDVIITDFRKAFDVVDHDLLVGHRLSSPILNKLLYYHQNSSIVRINDSNSDPYAVTSNIPQGSHLSCLLIILFINSIGKLITKAKILLFAYDIKICRRVVSQADCLVLQSKLNIFGD